MTAIRLEKVSKFYGTGADVVRAVDDVSMEIESGELFFLLGPSGCGKTTLLRIIAGLIEPATGKILFDHRDVTLLPVEKRNTAMVFQNYALWPHMTVMQNVEFGPKMRGLDRKVRAELTASSLKRVEMASFGRRKPNQLSGGQQQRVALARVLAAGPDCMLLDEPLSNLDAQLRLQMRSQLRQLVKSTGTTAVYVTHDQKEALSMADRIAVMNAGRIVQIGTAEGLYNQPVNHFVAEFLGEGNFIDGTVIEVAQRLRIETRCGTLLAVNNNRPLPVGAKVTCCIRPENLVILSRSHERAEANQVCLSATVESVTFLGEVWQYCCLVTDQICWKVTVLGHQTPSWNIGEQVLLCVDPSYVAVIPSTTLPDAKARSGD